MANVNEITTTNWQISYDGVGEIVENVDDIRQCIAIILSTPRGSDALRPFFGSDMHKYSDASITNSVANIAREAKLSVSRWEPRVVVDTVTVYINPEDEEKRQLLVKLGVTLLYNSEQVALLYSIDNLFSRAQADITTPENAILLKNETPYEGEDETIMLYQ